ncbi:glycosyltransferase family 90 protein [Myriangium duriaei CBS 260.36]|uniref:Glycosyltransferase family 90 protein n=1 Tax=Myriangium duriaei CBS 260.36 TaxID=1168546 RepID=A0A9P4IU46_9PEZI|nr:glycosyltransferase family 90 protein [Myriangium duriaei CBS 260.36]
MRVRSRPTLTLLAVLATVFYFSLRRNLLPATHNGNREREGPQPLAAFDKPAHHDPVAITNTREHPIDLLVKDSERYVQAMVDRQSKTLREAVRAYKARYGMDPPPHFDKWFEFARKNNVQIIDDYDTIYHSLLPFWGLKPKTIRQRVREALGFDPNNLVAILIRKGQVSHHQGGQEWQQKATIGMLDKFIHLLPDMDLAFNIFDEPRIAVPHDELSRLVDVGKIRQSRSSNSGEDKRNSWSATPQDLSSGRRVNEFKTTRFNEYAHQPTWKPSRLSCSIDSPARALEGDSAEDNVTPYAMGPLGFIYNHTAFTDVCNTPSFEFSHGFFQRPNAFSLTHDLIPIFSQSKMSNFQDILYPSPWYWADKVIYKPEKDMSWKDKAAQLWWVGSTTGGFSRNGGWRHQHRQKLVQKINSLDTAQVMLNRASIDQARNKASNEIGGENPNWVPNSVDRKDYAELMDVHFSHVGQCDPDDCAAQKEFFRIVDNVEFQRAWKYKFLLDIDGNAFSGRFYAFLKSKSLPFKMSVFREWHEEWIKPWTHFVPLSLKGEEVLETVRYFVSEDEGRRTAERLAEQGRMWAEKVLRHEDYEAWFFRLLLEYGRLIDDDRDNLGFQL